jgi:hypothetical protein
MGREELAISMVFSPTPAQKVFRPADEPPDSTIGVLNLGLDLPNCSATTLAKGKTVDEPAIFTWSRACAAPATLSTARVARAAVEIRIDEPPGVRFTALKRKRRAADRGATHRDRASIIYCRFVTDL